MNRFDPSRPDFAPYGLTCEKWTPAPMRRSDRHNEVEINHLRAGSLTYLVGGSRRRIAAGEMAIFWAALPHQIVACDGQEEYVVITLPLAWFLQCRFPDRLVQPILHGQMLWHSGVAAGESDRWHADLNCGSAERRELALLEIRARVMRLALELPEYQPPLARRAGRRPGRQPPEDRAEQMACYIAEHYTEDLTAEQIGQRVGLHPKYAMGLFRRLFGTTLTAYIAQHRVSHAQRLLATTDRRIVDIAITSGFGSVSRFNDVFRRISGVSPRAYRKAHQLGAIA